jgi:tetratricopeptide (TPR) repeat protein
MLDYLREAEPLAAALGDRRRLGRVAAHLTHCYWWMGMPDQAIETGQRALAIASDLGDVALEVLVNFRLGQTYYALGEFRSATDIFERDVKLLEGELVRERFGLPYLPAIACRVIMSACLANLGEFAKGRTAAEEGLHMAESADHLYSLVYAYWGVGLICLVQGNLHEATAWLERTLSLCQEGNFTVLFPPIAGPLGQAYALSGRTTEGLRLLHQATEQSASLRLMPFHPTLTTYMSEASLSTGQLAAAMESVDLALDLSRIHKQRATEAHAQRVSGEIHSNRDVPDVHMAEGAYYRAIALATELGMRPLVAHCHLGLGKLYLRTGDRVKADEHLATATTMYREMDMGFWLTQAEAVLGCPAETHHGRI